MNGFCHRLLLAVLLWLGASSVRADLLYQIDINTETLAGSSGYLELSLGGLSDAPLAILQLQADPSHGLGDVLEQFGNVSGDLADTLTIASDLGFASLLQQAQFGDVLTLQLQLSGNWLNALADAGLTFAIKLWSEDFAPLLSSDELGDLLRLELVPGGEVQSELFSEYVTVRPVVIAVPTPAAASLLLLGVFLAFGARYRRRQH